MLISGQDKSPGRHLSAPDGESWPVERATGLKFKRHPVVLRRSRAQVRQYVIHNFDQDVTPAEFAGVQAAYQLFGLLPDSMDLRRTMIGELQRLEEMDVPRNHELDPERRRIPDGPL